MFIKEMMGQVSNQVPSQLTAGPLQLMKNAIKQENHLQMTLRLTVERSLQMLTARIVFLLINRLMRLLFNPMMKQQLQHLVIELKVTWK